MADDMRLEYFVDADTNGMIELSDGAAKAEKKVTTSFKKMDKEVDKFGNVLTDADKAMGRFISKSGRMHEANGQFVKGMNQANSGLINMSGAIGSVVKAGAFVAVVGAMTKQVIDFSIANAKAVKELDTLATQSRVGLEDFQAWVKLSKTVNLTMEQTSQIFQDVSDRIGEFTRLGEGEFVDIYEQYLKPMGIGIEQLRNMKPDEVLQLVANGMRDAGASGNEMISAFEQIANDSSRLIPILDGTGEKVKNLKDQMDREGKIVDEEDVNNARILDAKLSDLDTAFSNLKRTIADSLYKPTVAVLETTTAIIDNLKGAYEWGVKLGDKLSTDAQKANISRMKAFQGQDIPSATGAINRADILNKFGYQVENTAPLVGKNKTDAEKKAKETTKALKEMDKQLLLSKRLSAEFVLGFGGDLESDDSFFTGISATGGETPKIMQLRNERELILELQELEYGDAQAHAARLMQIDDEIAKHRAQAMSKMLGLSANGFEAMADLVGTFAGEQSGAFKAMFAVSKSFALAQAALNMQQAISQALSLGFPQNVPMMAQAAAAGSQIASTIGSISYGGGRLYGGPTQAGKMYRVNENGRPEFFQTSSGQSYMMSGQAGNVTPASDLGGNNVVINQSFVFDGGTPNDQATMQKFAQIAKAQTMEVLQQQMRQGGMLSR